MTLNEIWMIIAIVLGLLISLTIFLVLIFLKIKYGRKISEQELLGYEAEKEINNKLTIWAKNNNAIFIPNALYKYNQNKLFEVDGILLTSRAIIVVEIKSINGKIKGNTGDSQWFKTINQKEYPFKSPVMQNQKHIDHILDMLTGKFPILSLIIFSNRSEKLEIENELAHVLVINEKEIDQCLYDIQKQIEPRLSNSNLNALKKNLISHVTTSKADYLLLKSFTEQK